MPPLEPPPEAVCEQARLSRDPRFDGLFFTAVKTTRVYCRPVCPAPPPKSRNAQYFATAAAAEAEGYRPCLRCRPELAPAAGPWRKADAVLGRALQLIEEGALEHSGVAALAARLQLSERKLRRMFAAELGVSPLQLESTRRLLFAKQLLTETTLPITEIAFSAGFGSLRRFNALFLKAYGLSPSRLRRDRIDGEAPRGRAGPLVLRLNYRPPYDFDSLLDFLRVRALTGLEQVEADSYARVIEAERGAWLRVSRWPGGQDSLRLEVHGLPAARLREVVQRARRMFDVDADPAAIQAVLSRDPRLAPLLVRRPGLRLPGGWDGFELAVRAVIGQQISVAGARTVTQRLLGRVGRPLPKELGAPGFSFAFPSPSELAATELEGLGLTAPRQRCLHALAKAVLAGGFDFGPGQTLDGFVARCTEVPGIGPWTAHYLALRALSHPDALPSGDLVLQKTLPEDGSRMTAAALEDRAKAWRPWRSYAAIHLWRAAGEGA